jgi:hypothetical protein
VKNKADRDSCLIPLPPSSLQSAHGDLLKTIIVSLPHTTNRPRLKSKKETAKLKEYQSRRYATKRVASSAPGLRPLPIPSAACAHVDDGDPSTPVLNAPLPPFLITLPSLLFLAASLLPPSLPSVSRLAWLPPQAELARQRSSSRRPVVDAAVTGSSARHPRRPVRGAPPRSGRRRRGFMLPVALLLGL